MTFYRKHHKSIAMLITEEIFNILLAITCNDLSLRELSLSNRPRSTVASINLTTPADRLFDNRLTIGPAVTKMFLISLRPHKSGLAKKRIHTSGILACPKGQLVA